MPVALPPATPPAVVAPAPVAAGVLTQAEADQVLAHVAGTLRKTRFVKAWPSVVPGMVALQMENKQVAYTDKNGRYFFLGVVFDTATGSALDHQMDAQPTNQ
ncbi:disulfide isomerase DsbC N-terminal domain-containing protein [Burkholderia cenocepacia]|uniref:disulfide isomerase DsbC N-terminal domain-containing protein n=1 Tax=Burkholderia cenocepacia TaxID=95486 RepID=UPI0009B4D1AF|nr:disulfide isomerase DsbC N-terminal domain-containing protein [Burkholderia cenocepacia]